jgi:hypothetical protein
MIWLVYTNIKNVSNSTVAVPVGISSLSAHSRTRKGNTVIKGANLKIQACKRHS